MKFSENLLINDLAPSFVNELRDRGLSIDQMTRLGGGRNSRVILIKSGQDSFVLKIYPQNSTDGRDRVGTEVELLNFLRGRGIRQVPKPLFWDKACNWAAYSWFNGSAVTVISPEVIDEALKFIGYLKKLSNTAAARQLPVASEACFSLLAHVQMVQKRLLKFRAIRGVGTIHDQVLQWTNELLVKDLNRTLKEIMMKLSDNELNENVPYSERILSPSDVGIHNMLRMDNFYGFVDFEYAGWDDPAKFAVDWILQPDSPLDVDNASNLISGLKMQLTDTWHWQIRLNRIIDLYRLKWCAIMLNIFFDTKSAGNEIQLSDQFTRTRDYYYKSLKIACEIKQLYN